MDQWQLADTLSQLYCSSGGPFFDALLFLSLFAVQVCMNACIVELFVARWLLLLDAVWPHGGEWE